MATNPQSFEEQLKQLEQIVEALEKGELTLEESLAQFERGVKLTRGCQQMLEQAQQKVALLNQQTQNLQDFTEE